MNETEPKEPANPGPSRGGEARAEKLSPERKSEIASRAAKARWEKRREEREAKPLEGIPEARYPGVLNLGQAELPVYVLSNGLRVIGRTKFTALISGIPAGGDLEKYLGVNNLKPYIDLEGVVDRMIPFRLPEVEGTGNEVKGLLSDCVIDVCTGYTKALEAHNRNEIQLTASQLNQALRATAFLAACAKVGLDALIDEATGYQYIRSADALQVKLKAYLEEEMRKWEPTFPEELWKEFGRLTNWNYSVNARPRYWGKLVMELVYGYLDADVAKWLKENAPAPKKGQNYHQWLTSQYGLKKLVEHIYKLIGVAQTCHSMPELRGKMAALYGKELVQLYLPVPLPTKGG